MQKAIVLITDVENHGRRCVGGCGGGQKKGVHLNVIGVGSAEGGPIPLPEGGYLRDDAGNMVVSKLNEQMGQEVVAASGGLYIRANDVMQTSRLLKENLDKIEKSELESTPYSSYNEVSLLSFRQYYWYCSTLST